MKNNLNVNIDKNFNWEIIQKELRKQFGNEIYESWLKKIIFEEKFSNFILVSVSTRFLRDWIVSRYLDQILKIIKNFNKEIIRVEFKIDNKSLQNELSDFLMERLKYHMKEENIRNDIIQASTSSFNLDQSVIIFNKAKYLNKIINKPDGLDIITSYKRASSILERELKNDKIELSNTTDPGIFKTELEKNLFKKISELRKYFSGINKDENYVQTLDNLASV